MGPLAAISSAFAKAFTFKGRASRSEYWWFYLAFTVICMACALFDVVNLVNLIEADGEAALQSISPFDMTTTYVWFAMLIPFISVTIRRLHDAGFSGFWILLNFVPLGALALLVMHMLPSQMQTTVHGSPASRPHVHSRGPATGPKAAAAGTPAPVDAHKRAMQGYAVLFEKDRPVTPEMQAARKAEISDYYRSKVLKPSASA